MPHPLPEPPVAIDTTPAPARGWTPALKAKFLDRLAAHGNARAACRNVGLSHEAAYRLRRRDAEFARGWAAAVLLARENGMQVLAERAIEGIEEEVWYRGEFRGTRRRYDARLLLAHLARLDTLADDEKAGPDAARFDELLACIAGEQPPGPVDDWDGLLPPNRQAHGDVAEEEAREGVNAAWSEAAGKPLRPYTLSVAKRAQYDAACAAAAAAARAAAETEWDAWASRACRMVDAHAGWPDARPLPGLPGNPLPPAPPAAVKALGEGCAFSPPRTLSHASTSALARALAGPACTWPGLDPARHRRGSLRRSAIDLPGVAA